jgi:hypothetical protein
MRILSWYKSWFRTSGTLDLQAYAKHVAAAFAFSLALMVLDFSLFGLALSVLIALQAPAWVGLPVIVLIHFPLGLLAIGSWIGILGASTLRFVRHLACNRVSVS